MIDPKELRIGNLVLLDKSVNTILGIDAISSFNIHISDDYYGEDEITPIPITPEWLERLGFWKKPQTNHYFEYWCNEFLTLCIYDAKIDVIAVLMQRRIMFVHQLQNLYHALTGVELTLRPE